MILNVVIGDMKMNHDTINKIMKFRDERNWKQFHTPRDLAISISIEAAELLENFQWNPSDENVINNKVKIADELADVLIYCAYLSDVLNIDIDKIVNDKIEKNSKKYSVEKAYGNSRKYDEAEDKTNDSLSK